MESPSLEPVPRDEVGEILERMEAGTDAALDTDAAREVALRGGYKAVIDGEVAAAGADPRAVRTDPGGHRPLGGSP